MYGADVRCVQLRCCLEHPLVLCGLLEEADAGVALYVSGGLLGEGRHNDLGGGALAVLDVLREGVRKEICLAGTCTGI